MNLLIDIGNSQTKIATGDGKKINVLESVSSPGLIDFRKLKEKFTASDKCILVSSGAIPDGLYRLLMKKFSLFIELTHKTLLPIEIGYETKDTLGMDRVASAVGAQYQFPGKNLLIIDAGTAMTIDMITKEGIFAGGNISPGIEMRLKALNQFTDKLPLVHFRDDYTLLGTSTEMAIRSGVLNGVIFEVQGYINALQNKYKSLTVVLTGGDAEFFGKTLKSSIFVDFNLIFAGLNRILDYNI